MSSCVRSDDARAAVDLIGDRTLRDLLEERVEVCPDRELLVFEDREGRVETFTYREFDARVNQLANGFLDEGIGRDEKVAVHLPNSPAFLLTWFALAKIGAVLVPSNTANTVHELEFLLTFSDATTVITEPSFMERFEKVLPACPAIRRVFLARTDRAGSGTRLWDELWRSKPASLPALALHNETIVELMFTSGTTARPKAVMITHANCLWSGERASKHFRLAAGDRNLSALPVFHVNAQSYTVLSTLTAAGTIVLLEAYSATRFWEQVRRHRADAISLVPALMRTIAAQPPQPTDRDHHVRLVIFGLNCSEKERADFEARFGVTLLKGYGLTEAMTMVSRAPLDGNRRWPSVGLPALDRDVKIVDERGVECERGELGEVIVKGVPGRTLMKGYYKDAAATAASLRDGWLFTEDVGRMDEAGYLYLVGRKKDIIKVGGENVAAGEVEQALTEHAAVLDCAVIGVPDPLKDEAVKAFVVVRPGASVTVDEIRAHCAGRLARFKVPQLVEFRASLPRTTLGKVEKKVLRGEEGGG